MKNSMDKNCNIFSHPHHDHMHGHEPSLYAELMCHLPYAIFSVASCLAIISFLGYVSLNNADTSNIEKSANVLFHSFHFMHLLFAATGALITFYRFSKNIYAGLFVGLFSPLFFCTLSDSILPYLAGKILGADMHFHICLFTEFHNILPFLGIGLINGLIIGKYHKACGQIYSISSHFLHILISSFASTFYLIGHGLVSWYSQIGMVFLFLVVAVVVPCVMSDIVSPMMFAKADKKNERIKRN